MISFSKRLFACFFSFLFLGILESSRKSFSFDYLVIETLKKPKCTKCNKEIKAQNYLVDKGGKQLNAYVYVSRSDCDDSMMCKSCYEEDKRSEYMFLIDKFCPNFKSSDDLSKLLENKSFIDKLPGIRLLMRFESRYEICTICKNNIDKFFEKIWYKCLDGCCIHEECVNKLVKNNNDEYIQPVCEYCELERVNPYISNVEGQKVYIANLVKKGI